MDLSWFQSQTAQQLRAEGRAEGRAQGRAQAWAEDVLLLLGHRRIEVSEQERERAMGCRDLDTLETWFTRAITAVSAAEVFDGESA